MTKLLLSLFVKEYKDTSNKESRLKIGKLAGVTGIICNLILFISKLTISILSGSVSIIADAANNLFDVSSSLITLVGFRLARRTADKEHPYGHARYEYLSGIAVSVIILFVGVELAKSSISKIITPTEIEVSAITFIILILSIGVKLWMAIFYKKTGNLIQSAALKAAALDSRNDVVATFGVLIGTLVSFFFSFNIDGYIGLAVALFILYSGINVAKETVSPLLGKGADKTLLSQISNAVLCDERVLGFHDLLIHDYGPGQYFASVHVEISAEEDPLECHELIDKIESKVLEELGVHLVIHYDPVLVNNSEWTKMKACVEEIIKGIDPVLSMHDFRIVQNGNDAKLIFDIDIPYSMENKQFEIKQAITEQIKSKTNNYSVILRFDLK